MARTGIAMLSDFTTAEMTAMVEDAGFSQIEPLSPEEAEERYFQGRTDGRRAPAIRGLGQLAMSMDRNLARHGRAQSGGTMIRFPRSQVK